MDGGARPGGADPIPETIQPSRRLKKPLTLTDGMKLYIKSMGKVFRVFAICDSDEEANAYCARHSDAAVVAVDHLGRVYLAEQYGALCPSELIKDDA